MAQGEKVNTDMLYPDRLPNPRRSLQTKAIIAVTALVTIPTALCGYILHHRATGAMEQALMRDSVTLGQTTSHLIEGYLETQRKENLGAALDMIMQDERIAFMVITDRGGRVIDHRYNEPLAWHQYQMQLTPQERNTPLTLNRSIKLGGDDQSMLVVRRQLIRPNAKTTSSTQASIAPQPPPAQDAAPRAMTARPLIDADNPPDSAIRGFVELGLSDPQQPMLVRDLKDATALVVAVISLMCVPLVIWWVRGWTTPLRRMLGATLQLGLGERFEQVDIKRDDEIGMLARSFNAMAENLSAIQNALIDANEQLEHKVNQRTRDLARANKRLEQEMVEKDQFIRAISHDLGAPLRNIDGLTSMLILKHKAAFEEDVLTKLQRISANVKTETELLNDLLELSRIKTRQGKLQDVDLEEMIHSISESLTYDLENKAITLSIDNDLPHLNAERNRMRQVFQNLIDNAIKYMPDAAKRREIHIGYKEHDGEQVFYVSDTGSGIAREDQQAVFQVFRRARYSGKNKTQANGRGVGLATVKTIIEHYGGTIWVESDPPNGATFYFTFDDQYFKTQTANATTHGVATATS